TLASTESIERDTEIMKTRWLAGGGAKASPRWFSTKLFADDGFARVAAPPMRCSARRFGFPWKQGAGCSTCEDVRSAPPARMAADARPRAGGNLRTAPDAGVVR